MTKVIVKRQSKTSKVQRIVVYVYIFASLRVGELHILHIGEWLINNMFGKCTCICIRFAESYAFK